MNIEFYFDDKNFVIYNHELHFEIVAYIEKNPVESILFHYDDIISKKEVLLFFNEIGLRNDIWNQILDKPENIETKNLCYYENLNSFTVKTNDAKKDIDLANFPNLWFFSCEWHSKVKGMNTLSKLRHFRHLSGYKPKSKDLSELSDLKELEYLKLISGNFMSLKGLEQLTKLKTLRLYLNRNVQVKGDVIIESVEELYIDACKQVGVDFYKSFPNVKTLFFDSNAEIESLRPILDGLKKLEEINVCNAKILEEDNTYWLDYKHIKSFNFSNKRHHKLKNIDFPNYPYLNK